MKTELTAVEIAKLQARVDWERTKIPQCADGSIGEVMAEIHDLLDTLEPAPEPEPKFSETVRAGDVFDYGDSVYEVVAPRRDRLCGKGSTPVWMPDEDRHGWVSDETLNLSTIISRAPVPSLKERVHYGSRFKGNHNNMQHRVIRIGDADVIFEDDWVVTWDYLEANYTLLDD